MYIWRVESQMGHTAARSKATRNSAPVYKMLYLVHRTAAAYGFVPPIWFIQDLVLNDNDNVLSSSYFFFKLVQTVNPKFLQMSMSRLFLRVRPWNFDHMFNVPLPRLIRTFPFFLFFSSDIWGVFFFGQHLGGEKKNTLVKCSAAEH